MFLNNNKIIKINQNQIYNFKRQIFNSEIACHNISLYKDIINDLLNKLKIKNDEILSDNFKNKFKNKKYYTTTLVTKRFSFEMHMNLRNTEQREHIFFVHIINFQTQKHFLTLRNQRIF